MDEVFVKIAGIGVAVIRNVYGSQLNASSWVAAGRDHSLSGGRRHLYVTGSNATDIEIVIGAMDLMMSDAVDGFCLVSSDKDFTSLAIRLREAGKLVVGFGEKKAPPSLRNACDAFHTIGEVAKDQSASAATRQSLLLKQAAALLREAHRACAADDGWATLSNASNHISVHHSGFSPRDYGSAGVKKLLKKCGEFDIDRIGNRDVFRPAKADKALKLVKT
jgi:hypothetical protein